MEVLLLHLFIPYFSMSAKPNFDSNPSKTLLVITIGFAVVYLFSKVDYFLYISIGVGLAGIISDFIARKIEWVWFQIAQLLSKIVPNIILSAVFFLFLSPIAWLSRIFGEKNPLHLKNTDNSLFKERNKTFEPADFEKPW